MKRATLKTLFAGDSDVVAAFDRQEHSDILSKIIQGPKGEDGIDGRDGVDGKDGKDGKPGAMGPMGMRGIAGPQGIPGENGTNGVDAKEISLDDVVEFIKKNKLLEMKDIKGMPLNMSDLRWHGGGTTLDIDIPVDGVIDGVNMTYTLLSRYRQVIVHVDGVRLKTTDYTISGLVVTPSIAPISEIIIDGLK